MVTVTTSNARFSSHSDEDPSNLLVQLKTTSSEMFSANEAASSCKFWLYERFNDWCKVSY